MFFCALRSPSCKRRRGNSSLPGLFFLHSLDLMRALIAVLCAAPAAAVSCASLRPISTQTRLRLVMQEPPPSVEEPSDAMPRTPPRVPGDTTIANSRGDMPTSLFGLDINVQTPTGGLIASVLFSLAFGLIVELVKFVDPNTASPSVFGRLL